MSRKIAERSLLEKIQGVYYKIVIEIYISDFSDEFKSIKCDILINGKINEKISIFGVDDIDAIKNSIIYLDNHLKSSRRGELFWSENEPYE